MKYNILIIMDFVCTKRDYDRFGIEILEQYFTVNVLDVTPWLKPHVWEVHSSIAHSFLGYHPIFNAVDFKKYLLNAENCLAIDYLGPRGKSKWIREKLSLRGIRRMVVSMGLMPELPQKTLLQQLKKLKYRTNIIRLIASRINYLVASKVKKEALPDIALLSGTESLKDYRIEHAKKIWAHSFDYDIYLRLGRAGNTMPRPYAVFIDQDIAHHSDLSLGWKPFVREENYYPALMNFFEMFEQDTGMEVVFAAHPRSQWVLRPHLLAGRVPVYGKTAELIRDAQIVFSHASTSISFAVLWQVPLVFLTTDELEDSPYQEEILIRSLLFKAPLINIDRTDQIKIDLAAWRVINHEAYDVYKECYIKKPGTPELPIWEIFAANIKQHRSFMPEQ